MNSSEAVASSSTSRKATVYVSGLDSEVNEQQLLDAFVTFGKLYQRLQWLIP